MSYILEIEKPDEIRCPYCLSWNKKNETICSECTTSLFDSFNFGAARALFLWEKTSSSQLKYEFSTESKDKIAYWNSIFKVQLEFFQKEFSSYNFLSKYSILDISEQVFKYFLSSLPMRPEIFKEYKEYEFPQNSANEIELLNITFRTNPSNLLKALAGLALIHTGRADVKIIQFLNSWNGHYKELNREKLLSFGHWSVQKLNLFAQYTPYVNEMLMLTNKDNIGSSWAKIFLYKADYDVQELKYALEEMINSGKTQLAISACFALRKYDKIKELLLNELDESTIDLAFQHSDERHIHTMLLFLKHAPRKYHESIIQRCVQLKPKEEKIRNQIVDWLLEQNKNNLLEVLFSWEQIPKFEIVLSKLLEDSEGIQALTNYLPVWIRDNQITLSNTPELQLIFNNEIIALSEKDLSILSNLRQKIQEIDFELLCEHLRKKTNQENLNKLFQHIFIQPENLSERQLSDGFYTLSKVAENTKATDNPYFNFTENMGTQIELPKNVFHSQLEQFILNEETKRPVLNWLFATYDMLISSKSKNIFESGILENHFEFICNKIQDQQLDVGTSCKFLKLIFSIKSEFPLNEIQQNQLQKIAEKCNDFEMKYWIEQSLSVVS